MTTLFNTLLQANRLKVYLLFHIDSGSYKNKQANSKNETLSICLKRVYYMISLKYLSITLNYILFYKLDKLV